MEPEYIQRERIKTTGIRTDSDRTEKKKPVGKLQAKKVSQIDAKSSHIDPLSKNISSEQPKP